MAAVHTNSYRNGTRHDKLTPLEKGVSLAYPSLLESYHYINKGSATQKIRNCDDKVFLDSGAFSAWTLGTTIDLPTYCKFVQENMDIIKVEDGVVMASVLDGIGDPQKTYENQMHMESLGVRPLPCFHFGEDERYLEWYLQHYDYITIGGMVGKPVVVLKRWLDRIWGTYLTDASGNACTKIHAFGITSTEIMKRYPWHSCDSSSWIQAASFGNIITDSHGIISVSSKSASRHNKGQHYATLTDVDRAVVERVITSAGFDYERLSTIYESRAIFNINSFITINETINQKYDSEQGATFSNPKQELF